MARRRADTKRARFPSSVRRGRVPREIREVFRGAARAAVGELVPGCEIFGFTKGQFSLINLIVEILRQTGPAHITISIWTVAPVEIHLILGFLRRGDLLSLRWIIDRSFAGRKPDYAMALLKFFGEDRIRVTRTHAKFVLFRNERWNLAIRTSMNLNRNLRFENFEISDCPTLAEYLQAVTDEIFARQEVGELLKRDTASVDASFRAVETGAEVEGLRGEQSNLLSDDLAELAEDWDPEELGFSDEEMSTKLDSALSDLATCIDDMAS